MGRYMVIKRMLKKLVPVTWKNPVVNFIFKLLDPVDYIVRLIRGINYLLACRNQTRAGRLRC